MNSKKEVQHVYLVGAKSLGAYGGYETFVYKLTEYHQNKENIKYHVACKANGDGCMDESKFDGVTRINEHEFELHNVTRVGIYSGSPSQMGLNKLSCVNMIWSPILALGSLGVGNRPAADFHRIIGISATPSSLRPGCELQKYLL